MVSRMCEPAKLAHLKIEVDRNEKSGELTSHEHAHRFHLTSTLF